MWIYYLWGLSWHQKYHCLEEHVSNPQYEQCHCETALSRRGRSNPMFQRGDCFAKCARNDIMKIAESGRDYSLDSLFVELSFFCLCQRDLQIEHTTLAQFTIHPDPAAMPFRDRTDNGQAKPGAMLGARFALGASIEFFK